MDLNSMENIRLLRNCIAIEKAIPNTSPDKINNFNNFFNLLTTSNDPEETIKNQTGDIANFGNYILSTPEQDILETYINLTKPYISDPLAFERFKSAMYRDFGVINTKQTKETLDVSLQMELKQLHKLLRENRDFYMSATQFKSFSSQFRDIAKNIGQAKFQQYFNTEGQIISHMLISDNDNCYRIIFTLYNKEHQKLTHTFTESIPTINYLATYIQNLCYSYIEADKFANTHTDLINSSTIKQQMNIFEECYRKFEQMISLKINISNNKIFFSDNSNFLPENTPELFENSSSAVCGNT